MNRAHLLCPVCHIITAGRIMPNDTLQTVTGMETLNVHSTESFGTYDGPGIRFVVFLTGCPFRCLYCANPDTISPGEGEVYSIERILDTAENMSPFFANGGGVTVSGGEPCRQAKPLIALFQKLKSKGIHTCLDTTGYFMNQYVEKMLEYTDLVLLDVKHMDPVLHKRITGRSNENTLAFAKYLQEQGKPFWLRYVLVPGLTDDPKHLHQLGQHFQTYGQVQKLEIQPYHKLGIYKWEKLGKEYALKNTPENTPEELEIAKEILEHYFDEIVIN